MALDTQPERRPPRRRPPKGGSDQEPPGSEKRLSLKRTVIYIAKTLTKLTAFSVLREITGGPTSDIMDEVKDLFSGVVVEEVEEEIEETE